MNAHLDCDDVRERGFPQAWWAVYEEMVQRVAPLLSGPDADVQILLYTVLADIVDEPSRSQAVVLGVVVILATAGYNAL